MPKYLKISSVKITQILLLVQCLNRELGSRKCLFLCYLKIYVTT